MLSAGCLQSGFSRPQQSTYVDNLPRSSRMHQSSTTRGSSMSGVLTHYFQFNEIIIHTSVRPLYKLPHLPLIREKLERSQFPLLWPLSPSFFFCIHEVPLIITNIGVLTEGNVLLRMRFDWTCNFEGEKKKSYVNHFCISVIFHL